ncbi:Hsp20/alpha crystallin family protein [bacterium]|nr:Hsp20/alpha crystallin family protein [bacterium]
MRDKIPLLARIARPKRRREDIREFRFEYIRIEQGTRPLPWGEQSQWVPPVDVYGNEQSLVVEVHLPGVRPEDTRIEFGQNFVRVSGSRHDVEVAGRRDYFHMEIERGQFQRVIQLPEGVTTTDYDARFEQGVLRMTFPYQGKSWGTARSADRFPEEWS